MDVTGARETRSHLLFRARLTLQRRSIKSAVFDLAANDKSIRVAKLLLDDLVSVCLQRLIAERRGVNAVLERVV